MASSCLNASTLCADPSTSSFDPAVIEIFHETDDLVPRRCPLGKNRKPTPCTSPLMKNRRAILLFISFYREKSILSLRYQLNNREAAGGNIDADDIGRSSHLSDSQRLISRPLSRA